MEQTDKKVKLAINGGITFGSKLNAKHLATIAEYLKDGEELELTTFQQLYITIPENKVVAIKEKFKEIGLSCYPVGNFVKSLRTCNFCKGEKEEGMPVAIELNKRIAGKEVPFTLRPAYTGCPVGCGEPLVNDIGVMKIGAGYNLYIGGSAKGKTAQIGTLIMEKLTPNELYEAAEKAINIYAEHGKKRETFSKFINRYGIESLKSELSS